MRYITFTLLALLGFTSPLLAEGVETLTEESAELTATEMVDKHLTKMEDVAGSIVPQIREALSQLAGELKIGVEHVYKVFVTQKVIEGISGLVMTALGSVMIFALSVLAFRTRNSYICDGAPVVTIISMISVFFLSIVVMIGGVGNFKEDLAKTINPEYYVIKDIADMTSDLTHGKKNR